MGILRRLKDAWKGIFIEAEKQSHYSCHIFGAILGAALPALAGLFKKGSTGETIMGAVGAGLGALGGKDKGYSPEEEEAARYKYGKKEAEDRIARADAGGLRPTTPRHEYWKGLPQISDFMQNAVMGSFSDIFGADTLSKWGSSYSPVGGGGGGAPAPGGGQPPIAPPMGGGGGGGGGMPPGEMGRRPMPPWMRGGMEEGGSYGRGQAL